ncbi:ead/Ea22-like family protein [Cronobacter sakazakii]|uniref:ead/Ea22-like family protein n=1 Tax=Cronobacter sakazakii TaxID=28141 RepID=UPI001558F397
MTDTAKLKAAALAATPGPWRYQKQLQSRTRKSALKTTRGVVNLLAGDVTPANSEFIALANPAVVLELIAALEAAEKRNAELEAVKNWWKPERCPVTNRPFFLWIEHPSDGMVPTYGGPFDSYTIPTVDSDGEFCCERYDHDVGAWVDSECLSVRLTGGEA